MEIFRAPSDLTRLGLCGFIVQFNRPDIVKSKLGSDLEKMETESYNKLWRLAFQVFRNMSLAYMRCVFGYPYALAGLKHKSAACVTESLLSLKEAVETLREAQTRTEPVVAAAVKRATANKSNTIKLASLFAESAAYKDSKTLPLDIRTRFMRASQTGAP